MVCLSLLGYLPPSTPTLRPKHLTLEIWTHYKWWWVLHSRALIESLTGTLLPCFYSQPLFQTLQTNVPWKCEKSLFHTFEESHKVIDFQQRSPSYFVLKLCLKCPLLVLQTELWRGERREWLVWGLGGGSKLYKVNINQWWEGLEAIKWVIEHLEVSQIKMSGNSGFSWPFPRAREAQKDFLSLKCLIIFQQKPFNIGLSKDKRILLQLVTSVTEPQLMMF